MINSQHENGKKTSGDDGDDINDIPESRTFLAKVSCKSTTIHWLELSEVEGSEGGGNTMAAMHNADPNVYGAVVPVPPDPNNPYYHHHAAAYQQQQAAAMKNHQQYFFPPQRYPNPYAASHAAWQAHYNQQPPPHMAVHPSHGQPLTPTHAPAAPGTAPSAEGSPAPPQAVSAGEAAAQQQKRNRQMVEDGAPSPIHPPPPGGHPASGPHGQAQYMLYQQMYQAQLPPMAHPPPYGSAGRSMPPPQESTNTGVMMPPNSETYNGPQSSPPAKDSEENDAKRQRVTL